MIFTDLFENTDQPSRIKFRGTNHDIGEERYRFVINGDVIFFNFPSDEDRPDPDSPSFEQILARVQRSGEVRHYRITPAEQLAIAKKIAAERRRYLDQRKPGVAEGHADQQREIIKKAGKPVGEIGIDRESSPGGGMYYMKHYASGLDLGGYDSREEAMDELRYAVKQGVSEAMKTSDIPPSMRDRLTMRDIEAERPQGAFRFRVTFPDGRISDYMTFDVASQAAEIEKGRISRINVATESLRSGEYHVATVTLDDGTVKKVRIFSDEGFRDQIEKHFQKQGRQVQDIDVDYAVRSNVAESKNVNRSPENPELWRRALAESVQKFDRKDNPMTQVWAAKWYESRGGLWKK